MKKLGSYVLGEWQLSGAPSGQRLVNPATEDVLAEVIASPVDNVRLLGYAREVGGPALRTMTFAQRGELLRAMSKLVHASRDELIGLAMENGGNTRSDAKFDIDGASGTLAAYADLGAELGDRRLLSDGDGVQLGRSARFFGQHVLVPREGAAVHVNAFNFPAWGLCEKAACALLAGMPVVSKPATATALLTHRIVEKIVEAGILPKGALSLIMGGVGDLLDHLCGQDVLSFTGSGQTATSLRGHRRVVSDAIRVNVEADSLNAAVLGPDVERGSETWQLFVADVVRDMTQKTGQKCTAIRRVLVPRERIDEVVEDLAERLLQVKTGDPAREEVTMGPVATASQKNDVLEGIGRLRAEAESVVGGDGRLAEPLVRPGGEGKGFFVAPVLLRCDRPTEARALHEHEVFGPVATVAAYDGVDQAVALVKKGAGGLVASGYSDDRAYLRALVGGIASHHGRLFIGSAKIAGQAIPPGTVLPQLVHGGPGRAGGGEELGGRRGLAFYQQRTALEGDKALLESLLAG